MSGGTKRCQGPTDMPLFVLYKNEDMNHVSVISPTVEEHCSSQRFSVHVQCAVVRLVGIISLFFATCPQILLYFLTIEIHRIY